MSHNFWRIGVKFSRNFLFKYNIRNPWIVGNRMKLFVGVSAAAGTFGLSGSYIPTENKEDSSMSGNKRGIGSIGGNVGGSIITGDHSRGDTYNIHQYNKNFPKTSSYLMPVTTEFESTTKTKCGLIYGRSQAGKSTFINRLLCLTGANAAREGDGSGHSVTGCYIDGKDNVYKKYCKQNQTIGIMDDFVLNIIDTPGFGDTELRYTDREILENDIKYQLINGSNNINQIDVIFLAETLKDGNLQVPICLTELQSVFGYDIKQSIVVLGLRSDAATDIRKKAFINMCKQNDLPYIIYDSMQDHSYNNQFKQVMNKFFDGNIKPFHKSQIEFFQTQIEKIALEIQAASRTVKRWTTTEKKKKLFGLKTKKIVHHHEKVIQKDIQQCRIEARKEQMNKIRNSFQ